jgi:hypothetical protein
MSAFSQWCDFHDYHLDGFVMDCAERRVELVLTPEVGDRRARIEFLHVSELQLVDLALDTIIDEIDEIAFGDLERFGDFSARNKWSLREAIDKFGQKENLRLWRIASSLGLEAAILAKEVRVTPIPSIT